MAVLVGEQGFKSKAPSFLALEELRATIGIGIGIGIIILK